MVYLSPGTSLSHHDTGPAVVDPLVPVTNTAQQSKVKKNQPFSPALYLVRIQLIDEVVRFLWV